MQILKKIKKAVKNVAVATLAVTTFASGLVGLELKPVQAATSSSGILSSEDRGVLYANSRSDFRDETIYFVITTRFYDGDSSNNARTFEDDNKAHNAEDDPSWRGDFKGLIEKLDYIKALGFTAVWITPVVQNDSGYDYHGYHAYNFNAVDTRYESNGVTYQDLIDACHAKGMKIIQDVVLNHTCNWGEENLLQLTSDIYQERNQAVMNGSNDPENIYHHNGFCGGGDWDNYSAQNKTIADDCFDLETENPKVYNYLIDAYTNYINMGVDAFRVDTTKHISRLTFNSTFLPAFQKAGGDNFYMFGEVCTKGHDVWYRDAPPISTPFYTWADDASWLNQWSTDLTSNENLVEKHYTANMDKSIQPTSNNAMLNGNEYHTPDYSKSSGLNVIDFQMHWSFMNANNAFNTARGEDQYFNDSTWNVVYVDSHDYAPDECQTVRYTGGTDAWAENLSLMFTFRGIPCVFYGSEIEFQKGKPIDVGPNSPLCDTGRAYYGDNIEGDLTSTDFTVFGNVSGEVANTLNAPLSQHIMRLNRIRQAVPALRKGQYSTDGCSGNIAFKRRYTDSKTDSFALVAISGNATFSGIPNGKYVDAITGDVKNVTNGNLSASVSGKGNMKIYVLDTAKTSAPGRVIPNGKYLTDGGSIEDIGPVDVKIVEPTGITTSKSNVSIMEGTSETVSATIAPADATKKTVTWSSSNSAVATVAGGTITGVSKGNAVITAKTSNGLTATVNVTVSENLSIVKPTGITVSKNAVELTEGDSETISATVTPTNATNKTVTWTSADSKVATVDSNGKITAVKEGTTTITAKTFNGYTATVNITVKAKEIPVIENGVYFEKPSSWGSNIHVYFFDKSTDSTVGKEWPGTAMSDLGDGIYGLSYKSDNPNLMVIFNDGNGNQTANLTYTNDGYYDVNGLIRIVKEKGKVNVSYQDESGKVLSTDTLTGEIGTAYKTSVKTIDGYTLKTTPGNASGTYTTAAINVVYVYKEIKIDVPLTASLTINKTNTSVGDRVVLTTSASGGSGGYTYKYIVHNITTGSWTELGSNSTGTITHTVTSVGNREYYVAVQDSVGTLVKTSKIQVVTSGGALAASLKLNDTTAQINNSVGNSVNIVATATGGSGNYTYKYIVHNVTTGSWSQIGTNSTGILKHTITSAGEREYYVAVQDDLGIQVKTNVIKVVTGTSGLSVKMMLNGATSPVNNSKGSIVNITASATGGTGNYTYKYIVHNVTTGSWSQIGTNSNGILNHTVGSNGVREYYVAVQDGSGTQVKSSIITVVTSDTTPVKLTVNGTTSTIGNMKGDTVNIVVNGTSESGNYTYKCIVHNITNNLWNEIGSNNTGIFNHTIETAGTREYYVAIQDISGNIVKTNIVRVVTE